MARSSTTASASGMLWYKGFGPNDMTQSLSMDEAQLKNTASAVVSDVISIAQKRMQQIIKDGGINKTQKGGSRIGATGDMYASVVDGSAVSVSGGRVKGTFGYSDNTPFYTKFQEEGTIGAGRNKAAHSGGGGIASMLAFASAQEDAIVFFQDKIENTKWFPNSKIGMRKW